MTAVSKHEHHYVPRLYLKRFGIDDKRINLYNLERQRRIPGASIADQCKRYNFYGKDNELENALSDREAVYDRVLRSVASEGRPPSPSSDERSILLEFLAIQAARTSVRRETMAEAQLKTAKHVPQELLTNMTPLQLTEVALRRSWENIRGLSDLEMVLVLGNSEVPFVTSDSPVVEHNLLFEGTDLPSGIVNRGAMCWTPISPSMLIFCYDKSAYQVKADKLGRCRYLLDDDARTINFFQVVHAGHNIYFNDLFTENELQRTVFLGLPHRTQNFVEVESFPEIDDAGEPLSRSSLLRVRLVTRPNLWFNTSFVRLRPEFKNLTPAALVERRYRRTDLFGPADPRLPPGSKRFGRSATGP